MDMLNHEEFVTMAVTLWVIWHACQKAIHEAIFQSPQVTHSFIDKFLKDLALISNKVNAPMRKATPYQANLKPRRPPAGYCKIHVHAGTLGRKEGSAAAVAEMREEISWVARL